MSILATILVLASAPAASAPVVTGPILMKTSEIRAYNATLTPDHPNYIRCVRDAETGSLVKRSRAKVCRTNAQWVVANRTGEQNARDTLDSMRSRLEGPADAVCKDPEAC